MPDRVHPERLHIWRADGRTAETTQTLDAEMKMSRLRSWFLAAIAATQLSCGADKLLNPADDTPTVTAATISVVAGSGQTGPVNTTLGTPVMVEVMGTNSAVLAGVTVTFTANNGGSANPASGVTGVNGRVSTTWTLGGNLTTQTLTATTGSIQASTTAAATSSLTAVAGVAMTPAGAVALRALTATATLTATALNVNSQALNPQPTFTWTSSDPTKATVSPAGVVTAVAVGSTTITATTSGVSNNRVVTVSQFVSKVTSTDSITLTNLTDSVTATAQAQDSLNQPIPGVTFTWLSLDTTVAKVTAAGKVYGKASGATRVRAVAPNFVYDSTFVVVTLPAVPAVPTLAVTQVSSTQIDLSWTNVTGETGYRVERCTGAGCVSFAALTTTAANVVAYSNTSLAGNSYTYRVRAENGAAASAYSASGTATTFVPGTPILTATAISPTQVNLSWFDVANETTYELQRCAGVSCSSWTNILVANVLNYNNSGVSPNTSYSYRARAVNGGINGAYSTVQTVNTIVPGTPNIFVMPTNTSTNTISWGDVSGETSYDVEFCIGAGCTPTLLATVTAGGTSYTHGGRATETEYRYRVRGRNNTLFGTYSNIVDVQSIGLAPNGTCYLVSCASTIGATTGQSMFFYVDVPAGSDSLVIQLNPGTGDADLYVKYGDMPGGPGAGVYSSQNGSATADRISVAYPTAGRWYVNAQAYSTYSGWQIFNTPVKLLKDWSFEDAFNNWTYSGSAYPFQGLSPRSGIVNSNLGVNGSGVAVNSGGSFFQTITVPSTAGAVSLEYYYRITTSENTIINTPYDYMYVRIRNTSGTLLNTRATYSNSNYSGSYARGVIDLTPWRGQTVRISFENVNDGSNPTHFRIDDAWMYWATGR